MGTKVWIVSKQQKSLNTETLADISADTLHEQIVIPSQIAIIESRVQKTTSIKFKWQTTIQSYCNSTWSHNHVELHA